MCGIVGVVGARPSVRPKWFPAALQALHHRGPDGGDVWHSADGRVSFGHRRLAIVDLSIGGAQPMRRGALTITFNGEIYNHAELRELLARSGAVFRSRSDTEVVLAAYEAWGESCLHQLEGMFAFALHDAANARVLLARDRAGEKPLFLHHGAGELRFASELKALLADPALPRRIDRDALDCYLGLGFVPGALCLLAGVTKLPPGHAMVFDLASAATRTWRWWEPPTLDSAYDDEDAMVAALEQKLESAVRRQLMADVPVGVLLSGGVDSSIITALAARTDAALRTFTVVFPGSGSHDESAHARNVAQHFGTRHTEIAGHAASVDLLPRLAEQFDEPVIDSSMVPTFLVSQAIRQQCTVALGGDGGDELFGGYSHHARLLQLQQHVGAIPLGLRRAFAGLALRAMPIGARGRNWAAAAGADLEHQAPLVARYFEPDERMRLLGRFASRRDVAAEQWHRVAGSGGDMVQRATRADFAFYLPEDILVKVDRASMMNSLEVRAPFLDCGVMEFAFSRVPSNAKTSPKGRKLLLRRLAQRLLPPSFDAKRKQGFSIPLADWLRRPDWRDFFASTLLDSDALDQRMVRELLSGQERGRDNGERLFGLVMLELWRRRYGVSLPTAESP